MKSLSCQNKADDHVWKGRFTELSWPFFDTWILDEQIRPIQHKSSTGFHVKFIYCPLYFPIIFSSSMAPIPLSVDHPRPFLFPFLWISSHISLAQSHFKYQSWIQSCSILYLPKWSFMLIPILLHSSSIMMPCLFSVFMRGTMVDGRLCLNLM